MKNLFQKLNAAIDKHYQKKVEQSKKKGEEYKMSKESHKVASYLVVGAIIFLVIGSLGNMITSSSSDYSTKQTKTLSTSSSTTSKTNKDYKQVAYVCAKMEVEDMLKSPSSADFPFVSYKSVTTSLGDDVYTVESYVDADNSFGAKIRTNYECVVTVLNDGDSCKSLCSLE